MDISKTIVSKSDQLNADDLIGGAIKVQVKKVTKGPADQPVIIHISGGYQPFKPSKTARRVLASQWGTETDEWLGRWMELYRDESVKWAGEEVGGIRVSGLSHIDKAATLSLATSRGKKANQRVRVLKFKEADGKQHHEAQSRSEEAGG